MNRRLFLIHLSWVLLLESLLPESVLNLGSDSKARFLKTRRFKSKAFPDRKYASAAEFWGDHFDRSGAAFAQAMERAGYVTKKVSYMSDDGQTLIQRSFYASKKHYEISQHLKTKTKGLSSLTVVSETERLLKS